MAKQAPDTFRVALISMPWAIFNRPSIQLGALKAWLDRENASKTAPCRLDTQLFHPYLQAAKILGPDTYRHLAHNGWAGEALYSPLLFPEQRHSAARLFTASCQGNRALHGLDFEATVHTLEHSLEQWLAAIDWASFHLVGFSICFSQLLASLAAAQRIKRLCPGALIVAGGSGCVGTMGASLLDSFPQLDYIISGEGEEALALLCQALARSDDLNTLPPRILRRNQARPPWQPSPPAGIADLNTLPVPDYAPYFQEMRAVFGSQSFIPALPLEFSRGCWWNRCAFCNLNLQWQGYRWKKGETVAAEVAEQARRHACLDFFFTDNALPPAEADCFFQIMEQGGVDYDFFAEIRVITDGEKLAAYRRGGLSSVQVGIEALSSTLLSRMEKGTTVIANIAAMKHSLACHIRLDGNLITEFPGSTKEEVAETLAALDFVLPFAPLSAAAFFLGEGSPISANPRKFGLSAVLPHAKNRLLFPAALLTGLEMLIKGYRGDRLRQRQLWQPVAAKIGRWQSFHRERERQDLPALSFRDGGSFLIIRQEQIDGPCLHHRLYGASRAIYLFCQQIRTLAELAASFPTISPPTLTAFLADLTAKRLLFQEGDQVLALALALATA